MERQLAAAEEGAAVDKAELRNLGQQLQEHVAMEGQLAAAEEGAAKDQAELLNLRQQLQELGTSMSLMQQQVGSACCHCHTSCQAQQPCCVMLQSTKWY